MDKLYWVKRTFGLFLLCATTAIALPAQTLITLHSFDGSDGSTPYWAMVQATTGNLYGTTQSGGVNGGGTVFKITPSGRLTTLYSFCSQSGCLDGNDPSGLVQASNGNFYGTTGGGGAGCPVGGKGDCGTVFRITPSGALTTLYTFCLQSGCPDGRNPVTGVIQAADGNFYGVTPSGGATDAGTVFKVTPSGMLTTLHSFCSPIPCLEGVGPEAGLIQATDGNFYGTTFYGGTNDDGTVFKITPSGTLTTLYSFCSESNCADGESPQAALIQATDGNFYGTTSTGGANLFGTIFKITPNGTLTTLYSFDGTDGALASRLIQANDGDLYGTTRDGGNASSSGTIFKITLSGELTTLYSFCSLSDCTDGSSPEAALVQDSNGNFYGTTSQRGVSTGGTVFSLSAGLEPFLETQPTSGKVAKIVKILGTNLTGATSVTFNGTSATFTVKSASLITTTVPAGATTGTVQVVTPHGTLSSNVPFRVLP